MSRSSFRWLALRVVPLRDPCKPALLVAAVIAAGCGGAHVSARLVGGKGYSFFAPGDWTLSRGLRSVQVSHGIDVVSVTRFPLLRAYRPELWPKVVPEIDRSAAAVASDQHGTVVARATVMISGEQARRYDVLYTRNG